MQFGRLAKAYNRVVSAYAGEGGFLDKHVAKVFNYLGVATMVGRNQSTSGHERARLPRDLDTVATELRISICERLDLFGRRCWPSADRRRPIARPTFPSFDASRSLATTRDRTDGSSSTAGSST